MSMDTNKTTSVGNRFLSGEKPPRKSLLAWLRARFLTGIVVVAPIGITIWLVWSFVTFVDARIKPLIPDRWNPETYTQFALPGLGVVIGVVSLTFIGAVAANLIGKSLLNVGERLIGRVPFVRNIHLAFKQIFETLASGQAASFKEVVMVEYPRPGLWAVGFVTADAKGAIAEHMPDMVGVFVPTTPNPTSGFLIYVNRSELKHLDLTVEEGAKLIISAGLVVPDRSETAVAAPAREPRRKGRRAIDLSQGVDAAPFADKPSVKTG